MSRHTTDSRLVPGEYTISVETPEGFTAESITVTVGANEAATDADLEIVEG